MPGLCPSICNLNCSVEPQKKPQIPPLRCAPVGMTILLWIARYFFPRESCDSLATELSSRPEWSWACGPPKVMKSAFCPATTFHGSVALPLSSRPGFPAARHWTRLRVRLSLKERRMRSVNATNFHRKSGGAKPRDLRYLFPPGNFLLVRGLMPR